MIVWGRWALRKRGRVSVGIVEGMCECCGGTLTLGWGSPMPWKTRFSFWLAFFHFFFPLWEGLRLPRWFWATEWCIKWLHRTTYMSTQNMKRFLGFHSTWMSSSLPRDSGSTLELAESRAANFQDFCQLIWKNVWRCQGCWVDFTDTDSKQRDGHQGEAMGVGRGCSLPVFSPGAFISWCSSVPRRGDVNNSNCLQDAASNLNMIKLIWFYRLEFLSDRNGWG